MKFSIAILGLSVTGTYVKALAPLKNTPNFYKLQNSRTNDQSSSSSLSAIIYGWDDDDEDESTTATTNVNPMSAYSAFDSEVGPGSCPPVGLAIAETISQNPDRMGSLARLAVAFSPPERGLNINDIENVQVMCVRDTSIEIEAILCENHGCVSLAIPIQFPTSCNDNSGQHFEGCALQNLEHLDSTAETVLSEQAQLASINESIDLDAMWELNSDKVDFPSWWIAPAQSTNYQLAADCDNIKRLLNADEFATSIVALAQDFLDSTNSAEQYNAKKATVAAVGPAGICMKVAATSIYRNDISVMDVTYPFVGGQVNDVEALRAVILGAITAAEDKQAAP